MRRLSPAPVCSHLIFPRADVLGSSSWWATRCPPPAAVSGSMLLRGAAVGAAAWLASSGPLALIPLFFQPSDDH